MNGAAWHLVVNHVPVIGYPFTFVLLVLSLLRKSDELSIVSYGALLVLAGATFASLRTGGPAAHVVRRFAEIVPETIHQHAHAADQGWYGAIALAVVGLAGLAFFRSARSWTVLAALGTLALSVQFGWVAHLGGLIRHPEIGGGPLPAAVSQAPGTPSSPSKHDRL